ncbi:MAG: hypothetical protein A3F10_04645 [Coxiella sp. RIFCSPHIGHO2_12_FULL_42_15]|nr:MAG: hypothetical protein A3F10_04645 [Coxiella sp. RIFCSPHIGHO2_12_FULL_42_15]
MGQDTHACGTKKSWYQKPLSITLLATALILSASWFFPFLKPFLTSFIHFWKLIGWAIVLGIGVAGLIDALVPSEYISNYLAQPGKKSIFYAAILGFIMSVCSHGVLAISMELYKKGASIASVITFLLASPWANLVITIMLIAFFGWKAFAFILAALIIAIISGLIYQYLEKAGLIERSQYTVSVPQSFSIKKEVKQRWRAFDWTFLNIKAVTKSILRGAWNAAHMVLWWIIIGTIIGSALDAYVPHLIFQQYLGPSLLGLMITLIAATLVEVCSEGSAPIAFSIYQQTSAFGNAFIFLMAGVVTDITEIGLIWTNIGKRAALWLPMVTVPQALLVAYLFNRFL